MISSGSHHVRCTPMGVHCTCGEPDGVGLTPMGMKLNGSRHGPGPQRVAVLHGELPAPRRRPGDVLVELPRRPSVVRPIKRAVKQLMSGAAFKKSGKTTHEWRSIRFRILICCLRPMRRNGRRVDKIKKITHWRFASFGSLRTGAPCRPSARVVSLMKSTSRETPTQKV